MIMNKNYTLFFPLLMLFSGALLGKQMDVAQQMKRMLLSTHHTIEDLWREVTSRVDDYIPTVESGLSEVIPFEMGAYKLALQTLKTKLKISSITEEEKQQLLTAVESYIEKVRKVFAYLNAQYLTVWHDPKVIEANMSTLQEILDA